MPTVVREERGPPEGTTATAAVAPVHPNAHRLRLSDRDVVILEASMARRILAELQ